MHDTPNEIHWHEPKAGENAGYGKFKRKALPYDLFMEEEGVPVYRGVGVKRVQDLPLSPWKRLGGRGSYIQLYGTEGLWGCSGWRRTKCGASSLRKIYAGHRRAGQH